MLSFLRFGRAGLFAALGEIALIVIGILLALQIDQWSADRVDRQKELEYLQFIDDGLRGDIEQLERLIEFNDSKQKNLAQLLKLLESGLQGAALHEKLTPLMGTLTTYNFFEANQIAFENLKSTDSLALISNIELQKALTEHYSKKRGLVGTSEHLEKWTRDLGSTVALHMVHDRWFNQFPEILQEVQLPMRSIDETRLEVTPALAVNLFYIAILNEAQKREYELELNAAQSLLDLISEVHDEVADR